MPPRARNTDRGVASEGKEAEREQQPQPSSSRKRGLRNRISAACEACKKRKTKCTGEPLPCHLCEVFGTECIIDLSQDMRRREAMRHSMNEARSAQESLSGLIDCIKYGDPQTIQALQQVFQQRHVTREQVAAAILHWAQISRSRNLDSDQTERDSPRSESLPVVDQESETQSYPLPLDPLLMENPAVDGESSTPTYVRDLLHRLKSCSEEEGLRILQGLLGVSDNVDFESVPAYDGDRWASN